MQRVSHLLKIKREVFRGQEEHKCLNSWLQGEILKLPTTVSRQPVLKKIWIVIGIVSEGKLESCCPFTWA